MSDLDALSIRTATPDDLAAVDALFQRSYPALLRGDYPPSVYVTSIPIISRAQPELLGCGTFFLAEREEGGRRGRLDRSGGGQRARGLRRAVGHVRHVVTDHRHTRQGIGRALLHFVMRDAATAGMVELRCQSTLTAVPFYRVMGFDEVGPISIELPRGIGFPAVLMRRPL